MGGAASSTPYKQYLYMLVQCSQMHAVLPGPYSCKGESEPQDWLLLLMVGVLNLLQVLCVHHVFDARTCRGTGGKA